MGNEVAKGSTAAQIIAEEERLYGQVQARVAFGEDDDGRPQIGAGDLDADLISLRDQIAEARPEDLPPLVEQMTRLAALRARLGGGKQLPVDITSPYFAHIRLRETGKTKDVLVGKRGFIDRQSNVQIVDWRNAPVSRIYYRYEEGDDYEEEIAGRRVEGVVEVRRNVSIARSNLRRIGAPQGTYLKDARGSWVQAVGQIAPVLHGGMGKAARPAAAAGAKGTLGIHHGTQRADKALPEIAALIDKEQFELITQPGSGIVVIQGGAGSGKTTVALHRIAYLNFQDGRRFKPSNTLFVVPSQALVRYVSGVLPSLGVTGVPVVTYTGWARTTRMRCLPDSPTKYNAEPPEQVSRVKKHPALLATLERWVARQAEQIGAEIAALSPQAAATPGAEPGTAPAAQTAALDEWNRLAARALVPRLAGFTSWVKRAELPPSERLALEGIARRWKKRADDCVLDWAELLTDPVVLAEGFSGSDVKKTDIERVVGWLRRQLARPQKPPVDEEGNPVLDSEGQPLGVDEDDPAGRFDDEDDPILLRLVQLKRGGLSPPTGDELRWQHVAVDEAQDRSALEIKVLLEAVHAPDGDPGKRSVTIAGDTAQRLVFDNNFSGWADLLAQTGQPAIVRPLRLSYRSTAEVMVLAREILGPELASDEPLAARPGEPVELHEFGDLGEAIAFLGEALRNLMAREPTASCAVIARHPEQADAYFEGLRRAEVPALRRVRRDEFNFQPGVDVTDIAQVKGLEFDYVVMVDVNAASYPDQRWARHMLHIGVTRAAHQLWLVSTGEPSELIPTALRDGGRMGVA
ncbi:MAG TPA: ATP-binding domain-containing protein [Kofleriaceae bacterium]|jgi:DNA helicase-2/ATP-dependent DNA helicase PcrA|nr:ATP-binding domain-containing protein [Kofleriaceae bacterium]